MTIVLEAAGPRLFLCLSQTYQGAQYKKQFGPLSSGLLLESLMFIGSCLFLAFLAAWLVSGEFRASERKTESNGSEDLPVPARKRRRKRRKKRLKAARPPRPD